MIRKILVVALSLVLFGVLESAYSITVTYETLGKTVDGFPYVCILEPDHVSDADLTSIKTKNMLAETRAAIDQWEYLLKESERLREDKTKWEIYHQIITLDEKQDFDYSICNVIINFEPYPENENLKFKIAGIAQFKEYMNKEMSVITIYYKTIERCETHRDSNYIYFKPCYGKDSILSVQLANTVRHEFGHALGLGHYYSDDDTLNQYWSTFKISPPSVMIQIKPDIIFEQAIKQIDIQQVRKIYGENGFQKTIQTIPSEKPIIPEWVRNSAQWWALGQVSDQDFAKGLEYLINKQIISVPIITQNVSDEKQEIPSWLKTNADWWSKGLLTDEEFLKSIQYLIEKNIIKIIASDTTCHGSKLCLHTFVERIVDGDTIYTANYKIRLSLTNTPERFQSGFDEATNFTKTLCPVGSKITVDQDDLQPFDVYDRLLGKVTCQGKNLNAELLYNNHAEILTKYCLTSEFAEEPWAKKYGC